MDGWRVGALIAALLFVACGKTVRNDAGSGSTGNADSNDDAGIDDGDAGVGGSDAGIDDPIIDWPPIPDCETPGIFPTSQLPRLENVQYDNTVRDLTGVDTEPSRLLAPDSVGSMDSRAWEGYRSAAAYVAEQAMSDESLREELIPCASADEACANEFIQEFGLRAYRRPLTEEEVARYEDLYANRAELTENGTFEEALQMLLEVFLISPSFLMRNELAEVPEGDYFLLSDYEVAARLSYMLWDSMPDEELFDVAAAGGLRTREAVAEQAVRMLQDPKARPALARFHRGYMQMGPDSRWAEMIRDPDRYPAFDAAQVPLLSEETERVFDFVVFENQGTFQDLLTTPVGFVNAELAPLYGLDPANFGSNLELVAFYPEVRPGVFTRAGFLASHSHYDRTAPSLRGDFLQEEVLCTDIPTPPPNTSNVLVPEDPNLATARERLEALVSAPECINCHQLIDPAGYALEGFDAVGSVQTTDNDQGVPVDTSASVYMGGEVTVDVDGASELMRMLAASPAASICYAKKWVEHAYQRQMNTFDECVMFDLARQLYYGAPVVDGLVELTQADSFRARAREQ